MFKFIDKSIRKRLIQRVINRMKQDGCFNPCGGTSFCRGSYYTQSEVESWRNEELRMWIRDRNPVNDLGYKPVESLDGKARGGYLSKRDKSPVKLTRKADNCVLRKLSDDKEPEENIDYDWDDDWNDDDEVSIPIQLCTLGEALLRSRK